MAVLLGGYANTCFKLLHTFESDDYVEKYLMKCRLLCVLYSLNKCVS